MAESSGLVLMCTVLIARNVNRRSGVPCGKFCKDWTFCNSLLIDVMDHVSFSDFKLTILFEPI